jgi:predicted ATPase with chaperone activity
VEETLVIGELAFDGIVRHVREILPKATATRRNGFKRMVVPETDAAEAASIPDLEVIPFKPLICAFKCILSPFMEHEKTVFLCVTSPLRIL